MSCSFTSCGNRGLSAASISPRFSRSSGSINGSPTTANTSRSVLPQPLIVAKHVVLVELQICALRQPPHGNAVRHRTG